MLKNTKLTIVVPIIGLGLFYKKVKKLKREGKIMSLAAVINAIPVMFRTARFIFVETKINKYYFLKRLGKGTADVESDEFRLADHWKCRVTDVICAVPVKSGTTWAQQICQQLRVGGNTNVNYNQDLLDAQPWVERRVTNFFCERNENAIEHDPAAGPGAYDMDADHVDSDIRVFKSHLYWHHLEGVDCKILFVARNTIDQIYSAYHFVCGGVLEIEHLVTPQQFATLGFLNGFVAKEMKNLCDFWEHRNDPNVGFIFYDDMKEDHAGSVTCIAKLMGIEPNPKLIEKVVEQSTLSFMKAEGHHLRFDAMTSLGNVKRAFKVDYSYWPAVSGQPPRGKIKSIKVKHGCTSSKNKKNVDSARKDIEKCCQVLWNRLVLPRTGLANLEEMRAAWKLERTNKEKI